MTPDERRRVIEDLKRNKKNRTAAELTDILHRAGFKIHLRTRGSHRAFSKPGCSEGGSIPNGRGHVLVAYVRAVIRALEECDD